jgi:hypothetical protein
VIDPTEVKPPSSSPSRKESRFTPGAMLADRFRIIALLGKGGMGEVYRAEDVKLGQQVALKFLPASFAGDPAKLDRLYAEVRLGRQVSHPNVCRVYDVMEWEGHHFISMEYIDGEDLASLLRRIGKLPHAKALDIARDLCAGLAAAHSLGIIHRDLKPANVMIDGRGTARVTDFGLAALVESLEARSEIAGTPAYMAPEQLSGAEVTPRTDLYAVGLILYEIFTGKRLENARSHSLSQETREIDPAVQRVILRCLEEKPESRPPSIHAVIAALPGGDPLQAALDAGETPSPEMVAAAGETGELRPAVAWGLLAAVLVLILINAVLNGTAMLFGRASLPKKPDVLADRARDILAKAGYTRPPADVAYNLGWNNDYFESEHGRRAKLDSVRPSPVVFYYRESPRQLLALQDERRVTPYDPPLTVSGMANVEIDASGRLIRFAVVPPELEEPGPRAVGPDWSHFISESGIDPVSLRPVWPKWRSPVDSDQKVAWLALYPEQPNVPVRVEAASHHGRPVWFAVIPPWQRADRITHAGAPAASRIAQMVTAVVGFFAVWGPIYLAQRNVRRSRGDRKGAFRLAIFMTSLVLITRAFRVDHVSDITGENEIFQEVLSEAALTGMIIWLVYIAIEPYFRRRWPRLLIGWNRLLSGRARDPMVGRDILIGAAAGTVCVVIGKLSIVAPTWFGQQPLPPIRTYFTALTQLRHVGFLVLNNLQLAILMSVGAAFMFLLLHIIVRNPLAATVVLAVFMTSTNTSVGYPIWVSAVYSVVAVLVFRFYGLLGLSAMTMFMFLVANAPMTVDGSVWYFGRSLFLMALAFAVAAYAFWVSLAAQPVLNLAMLEED